MTDLTRRTALLGALCTLGGCSTISSLNAAARPMDTYDLRAAAGSATGARKPQTLLIALPQASAAIATDRILIKPAPAQITYLPSARWSDELPAVVQLLLVRSIAQTGRTAYVGAVDAGPVPDKVLLARVDAFEVAVLPDGRFEATADFDLTLINDSDQRVIGSRRFTQTAPVAVDTPEQIVGVFQTLLDDLLPRMADWAIAGV